MVKWGGAVLSSTTPKRMPMSLLSRLFALHHRWHARHSA